MKLEPLQIPATQRKSAVQGSRVQTSYIPKVFEEKKLRIIYIRKNKVIEDIP